MDAGYGLRVRGNEFGFATFLEDGVHALNFDRFKRIGGSGIAHSVMDGSVVGYIGDDEGNEQNDGNFIRDGKDAVHQIRIGDKM
jgi:hypothetical protein